MTVFVQHDGDLSGYDIGRTLGEPTERMPDHDIEVIEIGLTVQQAIESSSRLPGPPLVESSCFMRCRRQAPTTPPKPQLTR
jgi:hypothetical protein